jgi:hypothetical protein
MRSPNSAVKGLGAVMDDAKRDAAIIQELADVARVVASDVEACQTQPSRGWPQHGHAGIRLEAHYEQLPELGLMRVDPVNPTGEIVEGAGERDGLRNSLRFSGLEAFRAERYSAPSILTAVMIDPPFRNCGNAFSSASTLEPGHQSAPAMCGRRIRRSPYQARAGSTAGAARTGTLQE